MSDNKVAVRCGACNQRHSVSPCNILILRKLAQAKCQSMNDGESEAGCCLTCRARKALEVREAEDKAYRKKMGWSW